MPRPTPPVPLRRSSAGSTTRGPLFRLPPMFYFYGGKRRLARCYPAPEHPIIVEPFAGSAAYSVRHLVPGKGVSTVERVILVEKDPRVCEIWNRLLEMDVD